MDTTAAHTGPQGATAQAAELTPSRRAAAVAWSWWPLGVCVVAGLLSTVVMAWACAVFSPVGSRSGQASTGSDAARVGWPANPLLEWARQTPPTSAEVTSGFGVTAISASGLGPSSQSLWMTVRWYGWPIRALHAGTQTRVDAARFEPVALDGGWLAGVAWPAAWPHERTVVPVLPIVPLWGGMLACWAVHAGFWGALMAAVRWAVRSRRRANGRCPGCGYPRLAGRCPECGAGPVRRWG